MTEQQAERLLKVLGQVERHLGELREINRRLGRLLEAQEERDRSRGAYYGRISTGPGMPESRGADGEA
jgi:hypothetical protein